MSAYATLLFVFTSVAAIIYMNLSNYYQKYLSILPTLEYCFLLTFFLIPLYNFNPTKITKVTFQDTKFVKSLIVFYFAITVVLILAYHEDFVARFIASEVVDTRRLINEGESFLKSYPRLLQIILNFFMIFGAMSYMLIFVFFFSISYLHLGKVYNLMAILGSLCAIYVGILGMDRSKTIFWMMIGGLCCVLFWKQLGSKERRRIVIGGSALAFVFVAYFAFVTINRFGQGEDKEASTNSVVAYAGQPYVNFCYFTEKFRNPDGVTLKYLIPLTHKYVLGDYKGSVDHQQYLTKKTGIECGVFCSVIGDFYLSDGLIGPFIITLYYLLLTKLVFRRRKDTISFRRLFVSFAVMIIPCVGTITYLYNNENTVLPLYLMIIMMLLMREKKTTVLCKE